MKEKKDCKIVQDLLPNYVEHLTSEETNTYINEHLSKCEECKNILKGMQKDIKTEGEKRDGREVDYIKKYNKKLKAIKNIQLVVLTLLLTYVAVVVSRLVILRDIANKQEEIANSANNFHMELRNTYTYGIHTTDIYYKDGKTLVRAENTEDKNSISSKTIIYQNEEETIFITEFQDEKIAQIYDREESDPIVKKAPKRELLDDLKYAMYHNIGRDNINGVEVYILNEDGKQRIINKKTGEPIKGITTELGDYENIDTIEYNTVTDKDVARPDLTGCEITDYRNK